MGIYVKSSGCTLIRSVASCMPVTMMPTNTLTKTSAEKRIKEKKYSMARKPLGLRVKGYGLRVCGLGFRG